MMRYLIRNRYSRIRVRKICRMHNIYLLNIIIITKFRFRGNLELNLECLYIELYMM